MDIVNKKLSFRDRVIKRLNEYIDELSLDEAGAGLSRLLKHVENENVAFISAFRQGLSYAENLKRTKALKADLAASNYSWINLKGGYPEEGAAGNEDKEEISFAVFDKNLDTKAQEAFYKKMLELCAKYEQDSVLISLKGHPTILPATYNSRGGIEQGPFLSGISTSDVSKYFTRIHGTKFTFN